MGVNGRNHPRCRLHGPKPVPTRSGDDWISGAQSMRAYMRGAEIAGIMAEHIRSLGWSARSQTNADSHVLHIPLVLLAGLEELSRIGELVLNPFVGPRFKSAVVTTDMPLAVDQPIDFGLQDFCTQCSKCARECPCGAISFGCPSQTDALYLESPGLSQGFPGCKPKAD
jgi:ferredoxin